MPCLWYILSCAQSVYLVLCPVRGTSCPVPCPLYILSCPLFFVSLVRSVVHLVLCRCPWYTLSCPLYFASFVLSVIILSCALPSVRLVLCPARCTSCPVPCPVYVLSCALPAVHLVLCPARCTSCPVPFPVYILSCALSAVHLVLCPARVQRDVRGCECWWIQARGGCNHVPPTGLKGKQRFPAHCLPPRATQQAQRHPVTEKVTPSNGDNDTQ